MPVKLTIYTQKWKCPRKGYADECYYPTDFKRNKLVTKKFRGFTKMADWLDKNKKYSKRIMSVSPIPLKRVGSIRKVVFDGVETWVERYGHI